MSTDASDFVLGRYDLSVVIDGPSGRAGASREFEMDESRVDLEDSYDEILKMLELITSSYETEELRMAETLEERKEAWDRFWEARDPDPATLQNEALMEFFRRVRHANEYFSDFDDGWKSDRGRVYIVYGPPDEIENRPMSVNSAPYEVWYYYDSGRVFVFVDRMGFGRYELVGPMAR